MSYQRLFDEEIGTPPPSTVDVERILRRRRRIGRFRRVVGAVSVLGALALVVTVAMRPGVGGPPQFGGPTGSPGASASAAPDATSDDGPPRIDEPAAIRLTEVLKRLMAARLPDAQFVTNRVNPREAVDALVFNHRYRAPAPSRGGEDYYFATADVKWADGTGSVMVMVGQIDPDTFQVRGRCDDEGPLDAKSYQCVPSQGPRGETVTTSEIRGTEKITYDVSVIRPDGVGVMIYVSNATFEDTHNDRRSAPLPPLTQAQAQDLALDPELTV